MTKTVVKHSVIIYEFECGWGSRIDDVTYFDTATEAKAFVDSFNASNDKPYVPAWYMVAEYNGVVEVPQ